jgi:hypothetical protein
MPKMTGSRLFAEMMRGYGVSHIFFVPTFMHKGLAEMEDMPIGIPVIQLDIDPMEPGRNYPWSWSSTTAR